MSERYTKLFILPKQIIHKNAPIEIEAGALLRDNQTGKMLVQLKFKNISKKSIKALKIKLISKDISGKKLGNAIEYQYVNFLANSNEFFGQKTPVFLANDQTCAYDISVSSVIFDDNMQWSLKDERKKEKNLIFPKITVSVGLLFALMAMILFLRSIQLFRWGQNTQWFSLIECVPDSCVGICFCIISLILLFKISKNAIHGVLAASCIIFLVISFIEKNYFIAVFPLLSFIALLLPLLSNKFKKIQTWQSNLWWISGIIFFLSSARVATALQMITQIGIKIDVIPAVKGGGISVTVESFSSMMILMLGLVLEISAHLLLCKWFFSKSNKKR